MSKKRRVVDSALPVGISYSGGSSSEELVQSVIHGEIQRPENIAVFQADTMEEHEWTYEAMARVEEDCRRAGIPYIRCARDEGLGDHLLTASREGRTRVDQPPVYVATDGGGRGRAPSRCTREFKVAPMRRAQSAWLESLGLPKQMVKWIGFGADEVGRAIKAEGRQDVQWETLEFPAIRRGMRRAEQRQHLERMTGRASPRFSMCTLCPHKSPSRWFATPEAQRARVYEIDESIRDLSECGLNEGDCYLTDRLIPIESLIRHGDPQPTLPGLDSYCDGGACFL